MEVLYEDSSCSRAEADVADTSAGIRNKKAGKKEKLILQ